MMTSFQIREEFIRFFKQKNHTVLPSSSLIPKKDPSLLFVNAGMNQFKDVFLGQSQPPASQVVTIQKCLRAGGKHNDLENVGETPWHHTFFEMMGNFSFGSYFKEEAVKLAWEFLTKNLKFPEELLYATVFKEDKEAYTIWKEVIGLPEHKIFSFGEDDNFWRMGVSGPCGPCSEIHYYKGLKKIPSPEELTTEIWNLVFMEFFEKENGEKIPLPKPSIDTGMGLERLTALMQGEESNYNTDIFREIIGALERFSGKSCDIKESKNFLSKKTERPLMSSAISEGEKAFYVLADHSRAAAFLISDGVRPGNEGANYVLRRIMRRAFYYSRKLNSNVNLLQKGTEALISLMKDVYPELDREAHLIGSLIEAEERQFSESLNFGRKIFIKKLKNLPDNIKTLSPSLVWDLYSTYGFPFDLTRLMAEERGYGVNLHEAEKIKQKESANQLLSDNTSKDAVSSENIKFLKEKVQKKAVKYHSQTDLSHSTEFTGYKNLKEEGKILSLWLFEVKNLENAGPVASLKSGQSGFLVTDKTCFYPEGGGPLGDQGEMETETGFAKIKDSQKVSHIIFHEVEVLKGEIKADQTSYLRVDENYRRLMAGSHSGTHLLNFALRKVLGPSTRQAGSLVEPGRLRFDFTSPSPITIQQINEIEDIVNNIITMDKGVVSQKMPYEEALREGALSLQGENYDKQVRVITMGDSKELCGGIHVSHTKDIKAFKISFETGVKSGVRRIVAYTGARGKQWEELLAKQIRELYEYLKKDTFSRESKSEGSSALKLPVDNEQACIESSSKHIDLFVEWAREKDKQIKFFEKQLQSLDPLKKDSMPKGENFVIPFKMKDHSLVLARQNLKLRDYLKIPLPKERERENPLLAIFKKKQSQLESLERKCQSLSTPSIDKETLVKKAKPFHGKSLLLIVELPFKDRKPLAAFSDQLKDKLESGIVVVVGEGDSEFPLIVTVTKDLQKSFPAGDILKKSIVPFLKGKGGGQSRFAQGVATDRKTLSQLESFLLKELKK